MPNRYIRASAIESPAVNSLSWLGEVFYRRLLNRVDDFGRFTASHALLRAAIFPLQMHRAREADIPRLLAECEEAGLLFAYTAAGKQCLIINKWEQGTAKHSEYPEPPANICKHMQTYVYGCSHMSPTPTPTPTPTNDSDTDTDHIPPAPAELVLEGVSTITPEVIYDAYPRKEARTSALKAITKVLKAGAITPDALLAKVQAYSTATAQWPESDRTYIPHPATWFNAGRYNDDPTNWIRRTTANHATATTGRHFSDRNDYSRTGF